MPQKPLPPIKLVRFAKTYRIIPSRYPPVDLFERIANPADWDALAAVESLTNPRLRDDTGDLRLVPKDERVSGPGASPIMAAFTHIGRPSRFSGGRYGVYYASNSLQGALHEVAHHQAVFLQSTHEPKTLRQFRTYVGTLACRLHDVRQGWPEVHNPDDYTASQRLGERVRAALGKGIAYRNVRFAAADNVAIFRAKVLAAAAGKPHLVQGPNITLEWDGAQMARYIVMGEPQWRALQAEKVTDVKA